MKIMVFGCGTTIDGRKIKVLKYLFNQLKRSIISNILFCLLLTLAGTLLCLGTGLLVTTVRSINEADEMFTTIALPDSASIRRYSDNYARNNNLTEFTDPRGRITYATDQYFNYNVSYWTAQEINNNIAEKIYNSDVFKMDTRRVFGAWTPGITPFISESMRYHGGLRDYFANTTSAFIAVVSDIEPYHNDTRNDAGEPILYESQYVIFSVTETLLLHPGRTRPATVRIPINVYHADGTPLAEPGKRYFILGRSYSYLDYEKTSWIQISTGYSDDTILAGEMGSPNDMPDPDWWSLITEIPEDAWPLPVYKRVNDFFIPSYMIRGMDSGYRSIIELPDDPSVPLPQELQNEIDELIEMGKKSVDSLTVLTTGDPGTMFLFHQGRAQVAEGREFTRDEITGGALVCLVHEQIAGINVGDIIPITLYQSGMHITEHIGGSQGTGIAIWNTEPYNPNKLITEPIGFEVIGKFSAPLLDMSDYAFTLDTVIIPDASIAAFPYILTPEMEQNIRQTLDEIGDSAGILSWASRRRQESDDAAAKVSFEEWYAMFADPLTGGVPQLNTIIIPNGRNEEFAAAVNAMLPEYSSFFRIYDQGYSIVKGALDNLLRGGIVVFVLCFAGWIITMIIFCLFYIIRKRKEAGLLFALGVNKNHRFRWVFIQCALLIIVSSTLTFGVSSVMYSMTLDFAYAAAGSTADEQDTMFSDAVIAEDGEEIDYSLSRDSFSIPVTVAGQLLLLLAFTGGISASITKNTGYDTKHKGDG